MILILGVVFITLIMGFGMNSYMHHKEFVEIQEEVSRLRGRGYQG